MKKNVTAIYFRNTGLRTVRTAKYAIKGATGLDKSGGIKKYKRCNYKDIEEGGVLVFGQLLQDE